jgi:hypothetical protein
LVEWTCTGSPCPWGPSTDGHAAAWPAEWGTSNQRLGYTVSAGIYLPASSANGLTVSVSSGEASIYAGTPGASSHRRMALVTAGKSHVISGVAAGEVVSVQDDTGFTYKLTGAPEPTTTTTAPPSTTTLPPTTTEPPTTTTLPPTTSTTAPPGSGSGPSQHVEWTCTGSPCPWGPSADGHAVVWPAELAPSTQRLGYTVSAGIYLPGSAASGVRVSMVSGRASVYVGTPSGSSHRRLAVVAAGESFVISGVGTSEVVSVQDVDSFTYYLTAPSELPPSDDCTDPTTCDPVDSINALWRCNVPTCTGADWEGGVIAWPSWSAYESNNRSGDVSRTVYSVDGELLYPYMGSWASGCEITVVEGEVLVVEWQRGSDTWDSTRLGPGETHTITLTAPQDGALIETPDTPTPFAISLDNCTPQPVPKP